MLPGNAKHQQSPRTNIFSLSEIFTQVRKWFVMVKQKLKHGKRGRSRRQKVAKRAASASKKKKNVEDKRDAEEVPQSDSEFLLSKERDQDEEEEEDNYDEDELDAEEGDDRARMEESEEGGENSEESEPQKGKRGRKVGQASAAQQSKKTKSRDNSSLCGVLESVLETHGPKAILLLLSCPVALKGLFAQKHPNLSVSFAQISEWVNSTLAGLAIPARVCALFGRDSEALQINFEGLWNQVEIPVNFEDRTHNADGAEEAAKNVLDVLQQVTEAAQAWIWIHEPSSVSDISPPLWLKQDKNSLTLQANFGRAVEDLAQCLDLVDDLRAVFLMRFTWRHRVEAAVNLHQHGESLPLPEDASFSLQILSVAGSDRSDFSVNVRSKVSDAVALDVVLKREDLQNSQKLGTWVTKHLKESHSCSNFGKPFAGNLLRGACDAARSSMKAKQVVQADYIGLQPQQNTFVLHNKYVYDLRLRKRNPIEYVCATPPLSYFPVALQKESDPPFDQGLSAWIDLWKKIYGETHLVELAILLGHIAYCMAQRQRKPWLILVGEGGSGKTDLIEFAARMLGFRGGNLYVSEISDAQLADTLHFLSGFPVFFNDPAERKHLTTIRGVMRQVFDGGALRETKQDARQANAFGVITINGANLRSLLSNDEDGALTSRCLILPISPMEKAPKKTFMDLVSEEGYTLPSSCQAIVDLLRVTPTRLVIEGQNTDDSMSQYFSIARTSLRVGKLQPLPRETHHRTVTAFNEVVQRAVSILSPKVIFDNKTSLVTYKGEDRGRDVVNFANVHLIRAQGQFLVRAASVGVQLIRKIKDECL
jgi:hypothetical protein